MSRKQRRRSIMLFSLIFLALVLVLVPLWWLVVPSYGMLLAHVAAPILKGPFGMEIEAYGVNTAGFLNTETMIFWKYGERDRSMPLALAVTNMPPYWALVLATAGLGLWRRLRVLLYGSAILVLCHLAIVIILLRYGDWLQANSEIPTAVIQFSLTLPFLLWVVFAYWDKLMAMASGEDDGDNSDQETAA